MHFYNFLFAFLHTSVLLKGDMPLNKNVLTFKKKKQQKDCLWKQRTHYGLENVSLVFFYGDLVYRLRKIVGKSNFSEQFRKLINRYKRIGYSQDIMRQTACLIVNLIIVDGYASLFNCTTAVRASDSMTASS